MLRVTDSAASAKHDHYTFDFERLDVYKLGLEFLDEAFDVCAGLNWKLHSSLGDQFQRSSLSILNNLAEGSRKSPKERGRYYGFSLDSARECIPMITVLRRRDLISADRHDSLRKKCLRLCQMLHRLLESCKNAPAREP